MNNGQAEEGYSDGFQSWPGLGTAPSCLSRPSRSQLTQPSTILPPLMRSTLIPVTSTVSSRILAEKVSCVFRALYFLL